MKGYHENYVPLADRDDPNPYRRFSHRSAQLGALDDAALAAAFDELFRCTNFVMEPIPYAGESGTMVT